MFFSIILRLVRGVLSLWDVFLKKLYFNFFNFKIFLFLNFKLLIVFNKVEYKLLICCFNFLILLLELIFKFIFLLSFIILLVIIFIFCILFFIDFV